MGLLDGVLLGGNKSILPSTTDLTSMLSGIGGNLSESLSKGIGDLSSLKLNNTKITSFLGLTFAFDNNPLGHDSKFSLLFNKTNIGATANLAGSAFNMINSFLPYGEVEQSGAIKGISTGLNVVSNIASKIPGFGLAVGLGANALNTVLNAVDLLGAQKANTFTKDNDLMARMGSSYGGSNKLIDKAASLSGKKFGLFNAGGRHDANLTMAEATRLLNTIDDIDELASNRLAIQSSMSDMLNKAYQFNLLGGWNSGAGGLHFGRKGLKITDKLVRRARKVLAKNGTKVKPKYEDLIKKLQKYADGGKVNIIPEGALHARLNHMDVNNITKKGIPVITQEGGEIVLLAEIERNEIIFTKEVTDELEKLYKIGTDRAAIEAGKLLAMQIMENTLDNTGLMQEVE